MTQPLPNEDMIQDALREVIDPEVHLNIVDLGLVYGIEISPQELRVIMTMTTPACPVSSLLTSQVEEHLQRLAPEGVGVAVDLVWDPPWSPDKMSEMAKVTFGWA
jgi:metal-sulfur cluster biosynthetic enzyme